MNKKKTGLIILLFYICIQIIFASCANIGAPTGGPKDTIPPQLVRVTPGMGTLNFDESVIRVEFNEPIQAKDLTNQLIITPSIEGKYKTVSSKNSLALQFEQPFDTNTTYTFNFREGVSDVTESNPAKDLIFAFSTGPYLDSLELKGRVTEVLTGKPVPDALVTLYKANDTLNTFNSRPYYLQKTNKEGYYHFRNLKVGKYFVYATNDQNKNLKTDARSEAFGFLKDTIVLNTPLDSLKLQILNVNTAEIKINNSRPSGQYYEITLNKAITDYTLEPLEQIDNRLYSNKLEDSKKIRVYNTFPIQDSLALSFTARDSIGQQLQDTLYLKFEESKRAKEEFKFTIEPKGGSAIQESYKAVLNFNKPVLNINFDSLYFQYDSLTIVRPDTSQAFSWNERKDKLTISTKLNANQPSAIPRPDSLADVPQAGPNGVTLYLGNAAFISVDEDSSSATPVKYTFADPKNYGIIGGKFLGSQPSFIIQLLQANNYQVVREVKNQQSFSFDYVPAGEYLLRVLIDENQNQQWDPGNVHKRIEPEPVIIHPDKIVLKQNWEIRDIEIKE